jgi:outer membrane lipoprotein SlyB
MIQEIFQGGSLWGGLVSGGISQLKDTQSLTSGQIDKSQYAVQTSENVTGAIGVMAGMEYGAILGTTILPGVGTVVGSICGGLLGHTVGRKVGNEAGKRLVNHRITKSVTKTLDEAL